MSEQEIPSPVNLEQSQNNMKAKADAGTGLESHGQSSNTSGRVNDAKTKGKQSFASLFKDNRVPTEASRLTYIAPPVGDIELGLEEIDSVEQTFGYCLIGYVMGPRPSPYAVMNFIKGWGGNVKFVFKENGWIRFQFPCEIDREKVLNGGPYLIFGRQLFLKKLPRFFHYSKDDMAFLPSWVQIHGLPAECWTIPALSRISSLAGKPVHTDMLTFTKKGTNYARVLVELDAKKSRVRECSVLLPFGEKISIQFKYELDPKFCEKCNSLGHTLESCGQSTKREQKRPYPRSSENHHVEVSSTKAQDPNPVPEVAAVIQIDEPESSHKNDNIEMDKEGLQQQLLELGTYSVQSVSVEGTQKHTDMNQYSDSMEIEDMDLTDENELRDVHSDEYELDSEDIYRMLSCVEIQDQEEWKTVIKKKKKHKKRRSHRAEKQPESRDRGSSSLDTEPVPVDSKTMQLMKEVEKRFFKKTSSEVRPPNTAFDCP